MLTLYTFLMIKGGRSASLGELAGTLGCSKQTVLRLLDQLESSGYGKLEPPTRIGREHYYRLAARQEPYIGIGVEELAQLALCRNLLLSIMPGAMKGIMENGSEKAAAMKDRCQIYTKGRMDHAAFQEQYARLIRRGFAMWPAASIRAWSQEASFSRPCVLSPAMRQSPSLAGRWRRMARSRPNIPGP